MGGTVCGCAATGNAPLAGQIIDIGTPTDFANEGVYYQFIRQGVIITKTAGVLGALSAVCTHRRCGLEKQGDGSLSCPCHGSVFDSHGKVREGPAIQNLVTLSISKGSNDRLQVKT